MLARGLLVSVALSGLACGGSPTSSPGFAQFSEGGGPPGVAILAICVIAPGTTCEFTRRIQNVGNACAKGVRGLLTFSDRGQQIASFEWALSPGQVVRPSHEIDVTEVGRR